MFMSSATYQAYQYEAVVKRDRRLQFTSTYYHTGTVPVTTITSAPLRKWWEWLGRIADDYIRHTFLKFQKLNRRQSYQRRCISSAMVFALWMRHYSIRLSGRVLLTKPITFRFQSLSLAHIRTLSVSNIIRYC